MDNDVPSLLDLFINLPCLLALTVGVINGSYDRFRKKILVFLSTIIMLESGFLAKQLAVAGGDELKEFWPLVVVYLLFYFVSNLVFNCLPTKGKKPSGRKS
jgi:hypothetical protein